MIASLSEVAEPAVTPVIGLAEEASSSTELPSDTANHVRVSPSRRLTRLPSTEPSPSMPYSRPAVSVLKRSPPDAACGGVVRSMVVAV